MPHRKTLTEEDFLQTYDEYADVIFRHCHLRIADRERSKELMCEAFRELWLFISEGNTVDSPRIFLYRRVNALIEQEQNEKAHEPAMDHLKAPLEFLHQLSPEHRRLCILHFVDGFSPHEIREIIGGSVDRLATMIKELGNRFAFSSPDVA